MSQGSSDAHKIRIQPEAVSIRVPLSGIGITNRSNLLLGDIYASLSPFNAREKFGEITGNVIGVQLASEKLTKVDARSALRGLGGMGMA